MSRERPSAFQEWALMQLKKHPCAVFLILLLPLLFSLLLPSGLDVPTQEDMFRTLAEVGATLTGLVGAVGVVGAQMVQKAIENASTDKKNAEYLIEKQKSEIWTLEATIAFFILEILLAIMGIGHFVDWSVPFWLTLSALILGGYAVTRFIRATITTAATG
jgi:uncharacterized membrane protein